MRRLATRSPLLIVSLLCAASHGEENDGAAITGTVCGIFVATGGTDNSTCGLSPASPCRTISQGIARAVAESVTCVFVQNGIYDEVVSMVNGVHI